MKKSDLILIFCVVAAIAPFFLSSVPGEIYYQLNAAHPYLLAAAKFALLATLGEMLGLRIKSGIYTFKEFGIIPRAVLWGFYGVWIAIAMKTFAVGAPRMIESFGFEGVAAAMGGSFSCLKLLGAFSISVMLNTIFAPVFMTLHKVTDTHIVENGGSVCSLFRPIEMSRILQNLDWKTQWSFIFCKTLPFFWIPAHTITFLLPPSLQVLFAAALGVALGVLLSIAIVISKKSEKNAK